MGCSGAVVGIGLPSGGIEIIRGGSVLGLPGWWAVLVATAIALAAAALILHERVVDPRGAGRRSRTPPRRSMILAVATARVVVVGLLAGIAALQQL